MQQIKAEDKYRVVRENEQGRVIRIIEIAVEFDYYTGEPTTKIYWEFEEITDNDCLESWYPASYFVKLIKTGKLKKVF